MAGLPIVAVTVLVLLVPSGSNSFAVTVAVFEIGVALVTDTGSMTITMVADAPLARVPSAHVIVVVPVQTPWVDDTDWKLASGGSVSTSVTPVAVDGPWFV